MPNLTLEWNARDLAVWRGGKIDAALVRALSKAGGDALRSLRTLSSRAVRERKRLKAGRVARSLVLDFPRGRQLGDLVWTMRVSGAPVPLGEYPHRQTRQGVSVSVNVGSRKLVRGAFVAVMRSGHEGVFQRVGRGRLPIRELFSSRVSDVFNDDGFSSGLLEGAQTRFTAAFDRLLPLELAKLRR